MAMTVTPPTMATTMMVTVMIVVMGCFDRIEPLNGQLDACRPSDSHCFGFIG
jgi:hypothetical protein